MDERVGTELRAFLDFAGERVAHALEQCESPIEQLMLLAMMRTSSRGEHLPALVTLQAGVHNPEQTKWAVALRDDGSYVASQTELVIGEDKYRLDFHVSWKTADSVIRVDVECDGHEYHERTPEQAERDKARDRALQGAGWHVARFTGREIWRAPDAAAQSVWEMCRAVASQRKVE